MTPLGPLKALNLYLDRPWPEDLDPAKDSSDCTVQQLSKACMMSTTIHLTSILRVLQITMSGFGIQTAAIAVTGMMKGRRARLAPVVVVAL